MEENLRISKTPGLGFPSGWDASRYGTKKRGVSSARWKENSRFFEFGETNGKQMRIGIREFFAHDTAPDKL
jgi:hypothetical protein